MQAFVSADVLHALGAPVQFQRPLLSASQINTFRDCARRWAFEYVWRLPRQANAAAELGKAVHAVLERWARHGTPIDRTTREGAIAIKMIKELPPPGVGYPEQSFYLTTSRHAYTGFIDLPYWDSRHGVVIIDHKTTSDLKWAKTPELLLRDAQALIYGAAACTAFRVDRVNLLWNYGTTGSKPRSHPVRARLTLPQIVQGFESIERDADTILDLHQKRVDPFSLHPSIDACEKYGGCPHRERCSLTTEEKVKALMTQDQARTNGLMAQLDGYMGGAQPQQPQQPQGYMSAPPQQQAYPQPPQQQQAYPQQPPQQQQQQAYPQQPPQQQDYQQPQGYPQGFAAPGAPQGGYEQQDAGRRPAARYQGPQGPSSPPNAPEAQAGYDAAQQKQTQETERKRGRPRKSSKAELGVEQQAFLAGVSAGIMRGATAPSDLQMLGRAALAAFMAEFPHEG